MPVDIKRLESALQAAHQAGDTQSAQQLAKEIRQFRASTQSTLPMSDRSFNALDATFMQQLKLASGYLLNADPEARKDMLSDTLEGVRFEQDEEGRDIVVYGTERAYLNKPGWDLHDATQLMGDVLKFYPAGRAATAAGAAGRGVLTSGRGLTRAATAGAGASAATEAASQAASGAFGSEQGIQADQAAVAGIGGAVGEVGASAIRGGASLIPVIGERLRFTEAAQAAMKRARELEIDLRGQPGNQVRQVAAAAGRQASPEEGAAMQGIALGVTAAREAERRAAGAEFDTARSMRASVEQQHVAELNSRITHALSDFDLGAPGMAATSRLASQLGDLADPSVPFERRLVAMENWRRRARAMSPKDGSPAQAATERAVSVYDRWLDDMFNDDLINGSPEAIQQWKSAREGWAAFKQRFDSNRVIRDLARKETTAEQMSQWLFNANAIGAKREAGMVVRSLNDILGVDSPEMGALRMDVVLDIAEPLFRDTPDIQRFVKNYYTWLQRNPTLKRELFPPEYSADLDDLVAFSRGIARRAGTSAQELGPNDLVGRVVQLANRLAVGHGIAQGGARIQATGAVTGWLRRAASGPSARRNLLQSYLGADPTRQLIPVPTTLGAAGAMQLDQQQ